MLRTSELEQMQFKDLLDVENLRIRWVRTTARLNPEGENGRNIEREEERYRRLTKAWT